ncbi:MAG: thioredoxin [Candidatus Aminicenantes bacterium]|nr:thioredoxin [Candidatus Aminicenantes bacterium]
MNPINEVTDLTFQSEVLDSDIPVLVDFWAPWCGPCRMVTPVLEVLAEKLKDRVKIVKLNTDENQQKPLEFKIMGIPSMVIFKNGRETERIVGFRPQTEIESVLETVISS